MKMKVTEDIEIERSKTLKIASALLFISGILTIVHSFITLIDLGVDLNLAAPIIMGLALFIFGYFMLSIRYLTIGITASTLFGIVAALYAVGTQTVDYTLTFKSALPIVAGILGYKARQKIPWLIEREEPQFRELKFTLRMIRRSKITLGAIVIILIFWGIAIVGPYITPYDPIEPHLKHRLEGPSSRFLLGTDSLGRDILSRIIYGTRFSMIVGIVVVGIAVLIGLPLGAVSGYFGGKIDELLMRFTDIVMAFPGLTLAMLFAYIMGRGLISAIFGLSLVSWTVTARLVRGVVMLEKEKEYVTAAKVMGKSDLQILFGEILPNSIHPIIVSSMMNMGTTIIAVAGLSFVGVGIQPPTPDWGVMINEGRQFLLDQPLYATVPGVLIITVVLAYNIVGDALRDALDPTLRRQA